MRVAKVDHTHDPALKSWVSGAADHADYPIQNLPFCRFSVDGNMARVGTAIGDSILDIAAVADSGLLRGRSLTLLASIARPGLDAYLALSPDERLHIRHILSAFLNANRADLPPNPERYLWPATSVQFHLPCIIGDYTDFFAGIHHAHNVGVLKRPNKPLSENYKQVPIAYHGRTSSVRVSGHDVVRPWGQVKRDAAVFRPTAELDYELELALWVGPGNDLGVPIPIDCAGDHVAGVSLLNDWSARDIQSWEAQPLGPFLGKNFLTSVSPMVITMEALAPFRQMQPIRSPGDPDVPAHLLGVEDQSTGAFDIQLEASVMTRMMRAEKMNSFRLARSSALHLYWTPAQMVAHHSSNGCPLRAGDLIGTGTISGSEPGGEGSLLEKSRGGTAPIILPTGEERCFLDDDDEVILSGWCERDGFRRIGLGEVRGTVSHALTTFARPLLVNRSQ